MPIDSQRKSYLSLTHARSVCRLGGVISKRDYDSRYKDIHNNLPANPNRTYKDWPGWGVFLGTGNTEPCVVKSFLGYEDAKRFCVVNKFKNVADYRTGYEDPSSKLPANPNLYYKDFVSWIDFLGVDSIPLGRKPKTFLPFNDSRALCIEHKVRSQVDYRSRRKQINPNMPSSPSDSYKESGWISWQHFLNKK